MSSPFLQLFPLRGPDSAGNLSKQELLSMRSFTDIRGCLSGGQATCLSMQDKNILPSSSIFHLLKHKGLSVCILLKTMREKCFSKYRGAQMVLKTNFFIPYLCFACAMGCQLPSISLQWPVQWFRWPWGRMSQWLGSSISINTFTQDSEDFRWSLLLFN